MRKRIWQKIVIGIFQSLLFILRFIPWKLASAWGGLIGLTAYACVPRFRRVAEKNLKLAYGDDLTETQRANLIKRVFQHFMRVAIEFLKSPSLSPDQLRTLVHADSYAYVEELLARGKGMILITAHFGHWELLARRCALEGYEFAVVARQNPDPGLNAITDRLRKNGGYVVHPRGDSPKALLQRLRKGGIIAILPDQKSDHVFIPFFGHLAGTVTGPAVLALKTGAPILPMFCPRQPDGRYRIIIKPEIDTTSTGDHNADVLRIMTDINQVIEDIVREYPDQWLWLHDRYRMPKPSERSSGKPQSVTDEANSDPLDN